MKITDNYIQNNTSFKSFKVSFNTAEQLKKLPNAILSDLLDVGIKVDKTEYIDLELLSDLRLRIKEKGGLVFNNRLFGQLALTRALGDLSMKENGLINTPYVSKNSINEDDALVVIASDGVWDVYDEKDITDVCLDMLNDGKNVDEIGKFIVKSCLEKGSFDNISCIIIQIN